jgi:hypothetical protein
MGGIPHFGGAATHFGVGERVLLTTHNSSNANVRTMQFVVDGRPCFSAPGARHLY